MAAMPAVKLLDLKKEADVALRVAWGKKDLPAMLRYLSQDRRRDVRALSVFIQTPTPFFCGGGGGNSIGARVGLKRWCCLN